MSKVGSEMTRWSLIFVAYISLFGLGFGDSIRGPYFPDLTKDLNLTDFSASFFFVVTSFVAALSGKFCAYLYRRTGLINAVRIGHLSMAAGMIGSSRASSFSELIGFTFIFGLGYGIVNVVQNILILKGAASHRRRQLFSGLHSIYALACIVAPSVASALYGFGYSWRGGFCFSAGLSIFAFLCTFVSSEVHYTNEVKTADVKIKEAFWIILQISTYTMAEILISTRYVLYLRRDFAVSPELSAQLLALFFILLFLGRILFSTLPLHRFPSHRVILWCLVSSLLVNILGLTVSPYLLVLCGLTMSPVFGVSMDLITNVFTDRADRALATCLAWGAIYILIMHMGVGWMTDKHGIGTAMWTGPICLLISILVLSKLIRLGKV